MRKLFITSALAVAILAMSAVGASASSHGAKVTIVHGVPGLTVDICVDGSEAIEDFNFKDIANDVPFAAGTYDLGVTVADSGCGAAVLTADDVALTDGLNATVVAHLDAGGDPTLTIFVNDTSSIEAGKGRATVRHTAQAPAVDIWADGNPLFVNLANPAEQKGDVATATYSIAIQANPSTSAESPAVGPVDLLIPEGTNRIVYAVGQLGEETFDLLIQDISGLGAAPGGVDSGSGDLAGGNSLPLALAAALSALVLIAVGGRTLAYRRSE